MGHWQMLTVTEDVLFVFLETVLGTTRKATYLLIFMFLVVVDVP